MIDCFLYHHLIYMCYFVAFYLFLLWRSPYGVVLCCYQTRFNFSLKVYLSKQCSSFLVQDDYYYYFLVFTPVLAAVTRIQVIAILSSRGFFPVFWLFSTMLYFGWFPLLPKPQLFTTFCLFFFFFLERG